MHTFSDKHGKSWRLRIVIGPFVYNVLTEKFGVDLLRPLGCIHKLRDLTQDTGVMMSAIWMAIEDSAKAYGVESEVEFWERFDDEGFTEDQGREMLHAAFSAWRAAIIFFIQRMHPETTTQLIHSSLKETEYQYAKRLSVAAEISNKRKVDPEKMKLFETRIEKLLGSSLETFSPA